jgi:outer membrane translocation and assembly module TamA
MSSSTHRARPGLYPRGRGPDRHQPGDPLPASLGLGAAVFYDVDNVFACVDDISLDLRHSVGMGLRYDSPMGLLRLDVGCPLNPRPQDRRYQWFFAFGQAF